MERRQAFAELGRPVNRRAEGMRETVMTTVVSQWCRLCDNGGMKTTWQVECCCEFWRLLQHWNTKGSGSSAFFAGASSMLLLLLVHCIGYWYVFAVGNDG